jgi:hypothetical protein
MTNIVENNNHITDAMSRIVEQFKNKPNILKLLNVWMDGVQELEEEVYDLLSTQTSIELSEGVQLARIGSIVGAARTGESDSDYRAKIYAQIAANSADGTEGFVQNLTKFVTGSAYARLTELFPAAAILEFEGIYNDGIGQAIDNTLAAGVRLYILRGFGASSFAFAGSDTALGFGTIHNASIGGKFNSIKEV